MGLQVEIDRDNLKKKYRISKMQYIAIQFSL